MKYVFLTGGIVGTILGSYYKLDSEAILAMICLATYAIMDRLPKVQEPETKTETPPTFDLTNITRLEVINHATNDYPIGRVLTMYEKTGDFTVVDAEFQDGHRTLKIFIS
jgi:hypothetical protein